MGGIVTTEVPPPRPRELITRRIIPRPQQRVRAGCDRRELHSTGSLQESSSTSDESFVSAVGDAGNNNNFRSEADSKTNGSTRCELQRAAHRPEPRKIASKNKSTTRKISATSLSSSSGSSKYYSRSSIPQSDAIKKLVTDKSVEVERKSNIDSKNCIKDVGSLKLTSANTTTDSEHNEVEDKGTNKEGTDYRKCKQICKETTPIKQDPKNSVGNQKSKRVIDNSVYLRSICIEKTIKTKNKTTPRSNADCTCIPGKRSDNSDIKTRDDNLLIKSSDKCKKNQYHTNDKGSSTLEVGVQSNFIIGTDKCIQTLTITQLIQEAILTDQNSKSTLNLSSGSDSCDCVDPSYDNLMLQYKQLHSCTKPIPKCKPILKKKTENQLNIPKCPSVAYPTNSQVNNADSNYEKDVFQKPLVLDVTICPTTDTPEPLKQDQHKVLVKAYTTSTEVKDFFKTRSASELSPCNSPNSLIRKSTLCRSKHYKKSFCDNDLEDGPNEKRKHNSKVPVRYYVPASPRNQSYLSTMTYHEVDDNVCERRSFKRADCMQNRPTSPCKKLSHTLKFGVYPYRTINSELVPCRCNTCACADNSSDDYIWNKDNRTCVRSNRSIRDNCCSSKSLKCQCNKQSSQLCSYCIQTKFDFPYDCNKGISQDSMLLDNNISVKPSVEYDVEYDESKDVCNVFCQQCSFERSSKGSRGIKSQRDWSMEKLPYQCHKNYGDLVTELEHELKIRNERLKKKTDDTIKSSNDFNLVKNKKNGLINNSLNSRGSITNATKIAPQIPLQSTPKKESDLIIKRKVLIKNQSESPPAGPTKNDHSEKSPRSTKNTMNDKCCQGSHVGQTVNKFNSNKDCWSTK